MMRNHVISRMKVLSLRVALIYVIYFDTSSYLNIFVISTDYRTVSSKPSSFRQNTRSFRCELVDIVLEKCGYMQPHMPWQNTSGG